MIESETISIIHALFSSRRCTSSLILSRTEISVQQSVLKCLRAFKFKALTPYIDVMLRLCDLKNLREVLTTYPLQRGAAEGINAEHRPFAVPYFTRALYPFMKKRTGRLGGRGAPGSARAAILNFMAAMESTELTPLLELLLTPMETVFRDPEEAARLVGGEENNHSTSVLLIFIFTIRQRTRCLNGPHTHYFSKDRSLRTNLIHPLQFRCPRSRATWRT